MEKAIQKAIGLAVKEGWRATHTVNGIKMTNKNWQAQTVVVGHFILTWFSDPLFWQALGKSLGWDENSDMADAMIYALSVRTGKKILPKWAKEMHRFIDHLIAGKSAESFFEELIK